MPEVWSDSESDGNTWFFIFRCDDEGVGQYYGKYIPVLFRGWCWVQTLSEGPVPLPAAIDACTTHSAKETVAAELAMLLSKLYPDAPTWLEALDAPDNIPKLALFSELPPEAAATIDAIFDTDVPSADVETALAAASWDRDKIREAHERYLLRD